MTHAITKEEAKYKLCRIKRVAVGPKGVPYCVTHDGRTIRYPDPDVKEQDSVVLDLTTGKIREFIKVRVVFFFWGGGEGHSMVWWWWW